MDFDDLLRRGAPGRRAAQGARRDDRGGGILDRRIDRGGAAVGAGRLGLFRRRRRDLYPRGAERAVANSRRRDARHARRQRALCVVVGAHGARTLRHGVGRRRNRRHRSRRQPLWRRGGTLLHRGGGRASASSPSRPAARTASPICTRSRPARSIYCWKRWVEPSRQTPGPPGWPTNLAGNVIRLLD